MCINSCIMDELLARFRPSITTPRVRLVAENDEEIFHETSDGAATQTGRD